MTQRMGNNSKNHGNSLFGFVGTNLDLNSRFLSENARFPGGENPRFGKNRAENRPWAAQMRHPFDKYGDPCRNTQLVIWSY